MVIVGYGFHPHLPGFKHKFLGKALGATMWFWIFYRARCVAKNVVEAYELIFLYRQDYPKLLVRVIYYCYS